MNGYQFKLPFLIAALFLFASISNGANAAPPHPDLIEKLKSEGSLEKFAESMAQAREKGVWAPTKETFTLKTGLSEETDTLNIIIILVDFSDNEWDVGGLGTVEYFEDLMFSEGLLESGSMNEFYLENSYGQMAIQGTVVGWYRLPETYDYYVDGQYGFGDYPQNAQKMTEDAVAAADPDIDFSEFDNDGDGSVEGLLIVHAGPGREQTGSSHMIHSHQWFMSGTQYYDGVALRRYSMQPEENTASINNLVTIGVFCHEFGHVLGLPDLYDTDYSSEGIGNWSLMAGGSWNQNGVYPAHFDAWCKIQLGYLEPDVIDQNLIDHEFPQVEDVPYVAKIWKDGIPGPEYFLVENRQKIKFDRRLPGAGLIIYHVDETQSGNYNEPRYLVAIEQADGDFGLEGGWNRGDDGDCYPGSSNAGEFSDITVPNSRAYSGMITEVAVYDISDSDSLMTASLEIEFARPRYSLLDYSFSDNVGGDADGFLELGESVEFFLTIENMWDDVTGLTAELSCNDPRILFNSPSSGLGDLIRDQIADNLGAPIVFEVPADMDTTFVDFTLTLSQTSHVDTFQFTFDKAVGGVDVLLVDDDNSNHTNYEDYFTEVLSSNKLTYEIWGKDTLGSPGAAELAFPYVLWFTGDSRSETLNADDRQFIRDYLDSGGMLFITGQDIAEHLDVTDPDLLTDYFKCSYAGSGGVIVRGLDGSSVGADSISFVLAGSADGAGNQTSTDNLMPVDSNVVCLQYDGFNSAGVEVKTETYSAVFLGFGFEGINDYYVDYGYDSRDSLFSRVLAFLESGPAHQSGDLTEDGAIDVDDIVFLISYVYLDGDPPSNLAIADANCDGKINLVDITIIVNYVFRGGPEPGSDC